jgi:hypothetical protein
MKLIGQYDAQHDSVWLHTKIKELRDEIREQYAQFYTNPIQLAGAVEATMADRYNYKNHRYFDGMVLYTTIKIDNVDYVIKQDFHTSFTEIYAQDKRQ